jgi:UDPglucose--hexose-1-phosphate uridylyltransferase
MPELRKDPIYGRWIIISTERGKRPSDFVSLEPPKKKAAFCPFDVGNEDKTPPEVQALRESGTRANTPGWTVRVVPNKFPALQIEGSLNRRGEGLYDKMNGIGAHEVIIETTDHDQEMSQFPVEHLERLLEVYRDRILDLRKDDRFKYILIFKNHGEAAGASLEHSHSQLIATPIIPRRVIAELRGSRQHFELKERCIYCDIVNHELSSGKRVVHQNENYVSFAPFAPRFPFETWVVPKVHDSKFENRRFGTYRDLAEIFKDALTRINRALNNPPYNFVLHTAPCQDPELEHYHWHFEIMPKLTKVAGFEWGTGFYINPTPPEDAADYLRQIDLGNGQH